MDFSIVIPAKDEELGLAKTLPLLREHYPEAEVIVVNDGSKDGTVAVCEQHGVQVVSHPYPKGNGAAIKSGARAATGEYIVFMDGDGQHNPADIERLLYKVEEGYDMVVGARGGLGPGATGAAAKPNEPGTDILPHLFRMSLVRLFVGSLFVVCGATVHLSV